jgi:ABC-type branched-subunit amino acid transport system substrate-binding protein
MKTLTAGVAAVSLLALAGCAGSDGGSAPSTSSDTVKIMVFGTFTQPPYPLIQIKQAAEAAVESVNADGGVNGTQIELIACDDQGSANGASACARQAVDEKVSAVVGAFTLFGDAIVSVLATENIPYILPTAISEQEVTSDVSFPVFSSAGPFSAAIVQLGAQGCDTVVQVVSQNATAQDSYDNYFNPTAKAVGVNLVPIFFPPTTTDFSGVASQIADAGPCALYGTGPQETVAILTALSQTGANVKNAIASTLDLPESTLSQLGALGDGIQVVSVFNFPSTDTPAVTAAVDVMTAYDPSMVIDESALNAYASVLTFAEAAALVDGDITASAVTDVLNSADTTIDTGIYAPTNFSKDAGWFPPAPRVADSVYQPYISKDGVYVPNGEPIDLATTLQDLG